MRHLTSLRIVASIALLVATAGCKKDPVGPTDCSRKTVAPTSLTINASDGSASVAVTAPSGCTWTASTTTSWARVASGSPGSGSGTVTIAVTGNSGGPRTGSATVAEQAVTLSQQGAPAGCTYQVSPTGYSMGVAGGVFVVQVATGAGCPWSYTSEVSWISVGPASAGIMPSLYAGEHRAAGPMALEVAVSPNLDVATRQGTATIAGQTLTVLQDGTGSPVCSYSLAPSSEAFKAAGGTGSLTVTTGANCSWSIDRDVNAEDWIPALFSGRKIGTATVPYTVRPNMTFQSRSGRLLLYGTQAQPVGSLAVSQEAASCLYFVNPTQVNASAPGGTGTFTVTTQPGNCSWTASPNASWLSIVSGAAGTGTRTVTYRVDPAGSSSRSSTIVVAGLTPNLNPTALFTVNQSPGGVVR